MTLSFSSVEDCGEAVEAVKAAARVLHPGILFPGDPGYGDDDEAPAGAPPVTAPGGASSPPPSEAAAAAPRAKRAAPKSSWPLKEGSADARAYAAIVRLGAAETVAIADELDMQTNVAASVLARLRRAGLIERAMGEHAAGGAP